TERRHLVTARPSARRACLGEGAQRMKRVVGNETAPRQVPQRSDGLCRVAATRGVMERAEKRRAVRAKTIEDRGLAGIELVHLKVDTTYTGRSVRLQADLWRHQLRQLVGKIQRDSAVAIAERFDADPDHFAGGR